MRRGLGVGRALIAVGAVVALVGCFLPWVSVAQGDRVLTANGLSGTGVLLFVASILLLLLVLLPYAAASGRSPLDRPAAYALVAGVGIAGLVIRIGQLWSDGALALLPPDRAIGLWLSMIGAVLIALGVGQVLGEKEPGSPLRPGRRG
jgi:hypothetical protein